MALCLTGYNIIDMRYGIDDILRDVRVALDLNITSEALENDVDTLSVDDIIRSNIERSAYIIERDAPLHLLDEGKDFGDCSIYWRSSVGYGAGSILLPEDFLRLVSFQMSDWSVPVSVAIDESNPLYPIQQSRYEGVRGNPQRPIVAIVHKPMGNVLEFYSCKCGNSVYVKQAMYIPRPKIEMGYIDICERLKDAVVYYIAYLTCCSMGNSQLGEIMLNNSKTFLE